MKCPKKGKFTKIKSKLVIIQTWRQECELRLNGNKEYFGRDGKCVTTDIAFGDGCTTQ